MLVTDGTSPILSHHFLPPPGAILKEAESKVGVNDSNPHLVLKRFKETKAQLLTFRSLRTAGREEEPGMYTPGSIYPDDLKSKIMQASASKSTQRKTGVTHHSFGACPTLPAPVKGVDIARFLTSTQEVRV